MDLCSGETNKQPNPDLNDKCFPLRCSVAGFLVDLVSNREEKHDDLIYLFDSVYSSRRHESIQDTCL